MTTKRLNILAEGRAITFHDLLVFMNEVCYEKFSKVVGSRVYTAEELDEKLSEQGWNVEFRFVNPHTFNFSCWAQVELGEVEGLHIGFSRRVMVQLDEGHICLMGFDEGDVYFENDPSIGFSIETLGELYSIVPESFNPKCFCDC